MVVMGGILYGRFGHCVAAGMVWGLSAGLLFGILFCDKVLRGFDKTGHLLAVAAGTGLTWILLTPAFYILFGLGRLLIKISGKDPMQRTVDPHAKSYWTAPKKITVESRYHKQF